MNKTKKRTLQRAIIFGLVWLVTLLLSVNLTWRMRSNQYRAYAEQALEDVVVSGILQVKGLVDQSGQDAEEIPIEQIAHLFYEIDEVRRVLRNVYVGDDPGTLSIAPSVWAQCGNEASLLLESEKQAYFEALYQICQKWSNIFEQKERNGDFDRLLMQLEEDLQVLS